MDGLNFSVRQGIIFGLLGPNGAGKSTTVKILTTLLRPDSGEAKVGGIDVVRYPDKAHKVIGCVSRKSGVFFDGTGRENLILQGQLYGLNGIALNRRVDELKEELKGDIIKIELLEEYKKTKNSDTKYSFRA